MQTVAEIKAEVEGVLYAIVRDRYVPAGGEVGKVAGATTWIGSKHEPSDTFTKDRPALLSRRVRTQPRTVTSLPGAIEPESACCTLTTATP